MYGIDLITLIVLAVVLGVAVWGPLGLWIATQKRRSGGEGYALGLIFGPFGVLIEALMPTIDPGKNPGPIERPAAPRHAAPAGGDDRNTALIAIILVVAVVIGFVALLQLAGRLG